MNMVEKPFHVKHIALRREEEKCDATTVMPDNNIDV